MKTDEIKKQVKNKENASTIEAKRALAKKNLPLIKEAIAQYGKQPS